MRSIKTMQIKIGHHTIDEDLNRQLSPIRAPIPSADSLPIAWSSRIARTQVHQIKTARKVAAVSVINNEL
jgi:hypothetical protein